jgi:hypothetical protein
MQMCGVCCDGIFTSVFALRSLPCPRNARECEPPRVGKVAFFALWGEQAQHFPACFALVYRYTDYVGYGINFYQMQIPNLSLSGGRFASKSNRADSARRTHNHRPPARNKTKTNKQTNKAMTFRAFAFFALLSAAAATVSASGSPHGLDGVKVVSRAETRAG